MQTKYKFCFISNSKASDKQGLTLYGYSILIYRRYTNAFLYYILVIFFIVNNFKCMASSSEDVHFMVNKVRNKKKDGVLYLMSERIAWCPHGKDHFDVSHLYADIKCKFNLGMRKNIISIHEEHIFIQVKKSVLKGSRRFNYKLYF